MSKRPFITAIAILLTISFVTPAVFFIAPQRASASAVSCIGGLIGGLAGNVPATILSVPVNSVLGNTLTGGTYGATASSCINDLILIPLARAIIRQMLQKMTASVITWINGGNGTGQPSYVQNLSVHLQSVGDAAAFPFFAQIATGLNSPFGSAISSSLRTNYLQQTSMAGFFAANMNTLSRSSPNVNAYLSGNWSQGGIGAWFALTTQTQNNPYTLYQVAQSQLGSNVAQAQVNRRQDLQQSGGFLSWCGGDTTSTSGSCVAKSDGSCPAGCVPDDNVSSGCAGTPTSPQAPCTNPDGTPAKAVTPGSIIHGFTQKAVVDSGFEQLISANDLDQALGAIISALLNQVLGGVGGLFGASQGGSGSLTNRLNNYAPSNTSAASSAISIAQAKLDQAVIYRSAWETIGAAAGVTAASLQSLASFCTAAAEANPDKSTFVTAATAQADEAQTVLTNKVTPIFAQVDTAIVFASTTYAFAVKVAEEAIAASSGAPSSTLSDDVQTLAAMPPSAVDVTDAQTNASATGGASANPDGSLTVSGGTLVDQLNLLDTNAQGLKTTVCDPQSSLYVTPST